MTPLLEVCVDSIEGFLTAQQHGADRIELCSALSEGGLTPSYGTVRRAAALAQIPVHVLVRPRGGNFVYTSEERQVMLEDIHFLRSAGVHGVVVGGLNEAGQIDLELTRQLRAAAGGLSVTFHRAFDEVTDPFTALDHLAGVGVERILTSGGQPTGLQGRERLRELLSCAQGRLIILGCGSLRPDHIQTVLNTVPLREIHFAARQALPDGSIGTDGELVGLMKQALTSR